MCSRLCGLEYICRMRSRTQTIPNAAACDRVYLLTAPTWWYLTKEIHVAQGSINYRHRNWHLQETSNSKRTFLLFFERLPNCVDKPPKSHNNRDSYAHTQCYFCDNSHLVQKLARKAWYLAHELKSWHERPARWHGYTHTRTLHGLC